MQSWARWPSCRRKHLIYRSPITLDEAAAQPCARAASRRQSRGSARDVQHLAACVEVAVRVLLEDPFAALLVKDVDAQLVAQPQPARGRNRLAADRAPQAHRGSTSRSGAWARTN